MSRRMAGGRKASLSASPMLDFLVLSIVAPVGPFAQILRRQQDAYL